MKSILPSRWALAALTVVAVTVAAAAPALAHCDTADGPVAVDVDRAIADGEVVGVLKWVTAEDEAEVRRVFDQALRVRESGGEAAAMADRYLLETVVRLHRQSEGAPYTGVKPAGTPSPWAVEAVDAALAAGSADAVIHELQDRVAAAVGERFERAHAAAAHASHNVEAGRAAVHAYVELVHFVKPLHDMLTDASAGHDADAATHQH